MDKPPSNFFYLFSHTKKIFSGIFFTAFLLNLFFSCTNTSPSVSNINAKVIYDFENEKDKPVQKLSICLEMKSEVRRIEQINIYHKESGYRWIIKNPFIFEANSVQYAGYNNCQVAGLQNNIPEGEYQVYYYDSQGRETFTHFEIIKNENVISNFIKLMNGLDNEKVKVMIALYDEESKLLFYSTPEKSFEVDIKNMTYNKNSIFNSNKKAAYFRLFCEEKDKIYVLPKVYKESAAEENVKKD